MTDKDYKDKECTKCRGKGRIDDLIESVWCFMEGAPGFPCEKCPRCKGTGKEPERNSYEYKNWR